MALLALGFVITGLVAIQLTAFIFQTAQGIVSEREKHQRSLQLLGERIEAVRRSGVRDEKSQFAWNGYRKFVIDRRIQEAEGICSFYLVPHDRKPLPRYKPGQYLMFGLQIPGREKTVIRCYSLSDSPSSDHYRVTIKRVDGPPGQEHIPPGLVSNFFHEVCREGDILDVNAPRGSFVLDPFEKRPAVLIAGGVGITPLLCMLNSVVAAGSQREIWLFNGVRNGRVHVMKRHLQELDRQHDNVRVITSYSAPGDGDTEGVDYDHFGHISAELLKQQLPSNNYKFYLCGPPSMMQALARQLDEWGVPKSDLATEAFGPASVRTKRAPVRQLPAQVSASKVKFVKSGKELIWDGKSENLLEFAESNGVEIESGCRAGSCGTCQVALVSGQVDYEHTPAMEVSDGCCLTCVGIPRGNVVLDA